MDRGQFVNEMKRVFPDPVSLRAWIASAFPNENPYNIITGAALEQQIESVVIWAESEDGAQALGQALADDPPGGDSKLPFALYAISNGTIVPKTFKSSGLPPYPPHQSWFVTQRAFVNRKTLREYLASLD